jgi:hypothetical protein
VSLVEHTSRRITQPGTMWGIIDWQRRKKEVHLVVGAIGELASFGHVGKCTTLLPTS